MSDDVTRKQYRELSDAEKTAMLNVKKAGDALLDAINEGCNGPREGALARTNCEQAIMWAVKGITG